MTKFGLAQPVRRVEDPRLLKGVEMAPHTERAKLAWLREQLPDLVAQGRRLLVFSQFTAMLDLVADELAELGLPHLQLTGATPAGRRGDIVARFQAQQVPLLLALGEGERALDAAVAAGDPDLAHVALFAALRSRPLPAFLALLRQGRASGRNCLIRVRPDADALLIGGAAVFA